MATIEDVGTVIHVLRVIRSLSQGDLAEASGVRNSSISNYERGKAVPKLETLQKLTDGMGLPLSAVQETQEFIHRMRAQLRRSGSVTGGALASGLLSGEPSSPNPDALLTEMDQLAADSGRLVSRLLRVVLQILATEGLRSAGPEGTPPAGAPDSG